VIFWTPDHGAVIVRGAINAAWDKLGGATGDLGAPVADQTQDGTVVTQRFSGGSISWDSESQRFSTEPAGLAPQLAGLEVPGEEPSQSPPPSAQPSENPENSGLKWTWWWLLAIVPLLLLAGLAAFAVMRGRHRRDQDDYFADPGPDDRRDYEPALVGEGAQAGGEDAREDTLFGDRYSREGLGSLSAVTPTPSPVEGLTSEPVNFWGAPAPLDAESGLADETERSGLGPESSDPENTEQENTDAIDTAPTRVLTPAEASTGVSDEADFVDDFVDDGVDDFVDDGVDEDADEAGYVGDDPDDLGEWPDEHQGPHPHDGDDLSADREPLLSPIVAPAPGRDPMTDTGRHARIDFDEPLPQGTALHMPYDDPTEIPEGYPVKADTKSGLYWTPDSVDYHEAPVEIWFATEEIARTNGFIRGE
jgi:uncharacterized protein with LGFP repeats